ncbi:MAG TPA: ATPase domain-containing protein [Thermoanaerobaculia bacterium]|nr:ATPase domain-containing protein [Thermoanaerobaculia bacterium]
MPMEAPVQEPAQSRSNEGERIISGIDLLDYAAGGLPPHKLYLVRGGSGTGKSVMGLQFLARGLELHEPGILITDQKPANVLEQAQAIGLGIEESVRRGQLMILNPGSRYFELVESPVDVMAIVEELRDHIQRIGARRLVIDPVFTLINTLYSSHFAVSLTQSLINALEDLPVTTLLIASDEGQPELSPIMHQLAQNASGVIDLSQDSGMSSRTMKLSRMRHASGQNLSAPYRIESGRGLVNYREEEIPATQKSGEEVGEVSRSVLILGAGPETIRSVKDALGSNYSVSSESDLTAGVERAKRERPGLVLLTPSRSVTAVGAILDLAKNATSSLAFLSPASNRHGDKVLYLRAGADDFITEPFTPAEFRARVDALIRRSGRRLNLRDSSLAGITPEEITSLMGSSESTPRTAGPVITGDDAQPSFNSEFRDKLQRNVDTVAKFDQPFALYWIKASDQDPELSRSVAKICRQEDVVCHNRDGEFVAILTGTDQNGVKGFESRLRQNLDGFESGRIRHGYSLYQPGGPTEVSA